MRAALALLLVLTLGLLGSAAPAGAAEGQPRSSYPTIDRDPVGANDWSCRPTAARPYPAVLVHGTFGDRSSLLDALSYSLKSDGYCVFSLDYGDRATGPIEDSAAQLADFVAKVLKATGAARVEMVGHSQGGMMPRYYIKYLGGDGLVEDLNNPDETPGDVDYTQVVTRYDEVVVPYTSGFLTGDRSTNITLQDHCPADTTDHAGIPMDRQAIAWVLDAFDHPGPADPQAPIGCL